MSKPWKEPEDLLDREKYSIFLTDYLINRGGPFVLNINSGWGTGKTYFIENWYQSIKEKHPAVYVNAWKSDYTNDPILSVMSSIKSRIEKYLPDEAKVENEFKSLLSASGRFVKGISPIIAKGLISKAIGEEAKSDAAEFLQLDASDAGEVAEKSMMALLENHRQKEESIEKFQETLSNLVQKSTDREHYEAPLFVFIDELDRCRPTYSIELLETVKHLFSVNGVIFVIATDSEQLQHSICAVYGNDFDGGEYIRRFFDQEYKLPEPDYNEYCQVVINKINNIDALEMWYFQYWNVNGNIVNEPNGWLHQNSIVSYLSVLSKNYSLSLRTIEQIATRIDAIVTSNDKKWDGVLLILLVVLDAKFRGILLLIKKSWFSGLRQSERDELRHFLVGNNQTMKWQYMNPGSRQVSSESYKISEIAHDYINSISTASSMSNAEIQKLDDEGSNLSAIINSLLIEQRIRDSDINDLTKYIDYVEMAGALT